MIDAMIKKSTHSTKNCDAYFLINKSFGAAGCSDCTKHKDEDRKKRYIDRHKKMKIGTTLNVLVIYHVISYGINQRLENQLIMQMKSIKHITLNYHDCLFDKLRTN